MEFTDDAEGTGPSEKSGSVCGADGGDTHGAAWGKQTALRMFTEAGFENVTVKELDRDLMNCCCVMSP